MFREIGDWLDDKIEAAIDGFCNFLDNNTAYVPEWFRNGSILAPTIFTVLIVIVPLAIIGVIGKGIWVVLRALGRFYDRHFG